MANKKKTVTQRQWLNIMTIAIAFMILLFVVAGKIMEKKWDEQHSLGSFESITIDDWKAFRVDGSWHQSPTVLSNEELTQLILFWQTLEAESVSVNQDFAALHTINLIINGSSLELTLIKADSYQLQNMANHTAYQLSKDDYARLFPSSLRQ